MLQDLLTVAEATKKYGLSGGFLRRLLRQRRIEGRRMGNSWVIVSSSLDAYLKSERKKGRPPIDK
jgi:excisionase family DNA binding protein